MHLTDVPSMNICSLRGLAHNAILLPRFQLRAEGTARCLKSDLSRKNNPIRRQAGAGLARSWKSEDGKSPYPETHSLRPGEHYYAIVVTADGEDLIDLLVRAGLARIYGTRTPLPDGRDSRSYLAKLGELEAEAKREGRGGWRR